MLAPDGPCAGAVPANLREGRSGAQRSGGPHEDAGTARVLTLQRCVCTSIERIPKLKFYEKNLNFSK